MQVILSQKKSGKQLELVTAVPPLDVSSKISEILSIIFNQNVANENQDDLIIAEEGNFVNYIFKIPSEWNKDNYEHLMITATLDEHENPKIFQKMFKKTVNRFQEDKDIYKGLYKGKKEDLEINKKYEKIKALIEQCDMEITKMLKRQHTAFAELTVLGIQAVGKSSIIQRIIKGKFPEYIRPTLSTQILKMLFEQMDFRVYDVGGQKKLRERWTTSCPRPNGIVYVIDATHNELLHKESAKEFQKMMNFYLGSESTSNIPQNTPVLILANKIDLNPDFDFETINTFYKPQEFDIFYKIGATSALDGTGVEENFKWLSDNIKNTIKY